MNTKIYVITHKKFKCPKLEGYLPLAVGATANKNLDYIGDNTGENISEKNKNFCELTGVYWIWKNDHSSDIVGISHYRRYFTKQHFFRNPKKLLDKKTIEKTLKKYDVILPPKEIYKETATEQYCLSSGFKEDLDKVEKIIIDKYPDYHDTYKKIMNQNLMHQFNMLIITKEKYNSYCDWLFNILFELEKDVDLSNGYNNYQKRIFGFLSERLLNVWVYSNKLKIKKIRVINIDNTFMEIIKLNLRRIKNEIIYLTKKRCKNGDNF